MLGAAWFTIFAVGALVVAALSIGTSASAISWQRSHVLGVVMALLATCDVFDLGGYGLTRKREHS